MSDILGVALTKCYYCQQGSEIIINTKLTPSHKKYVEHHFHGKTMNMNPCSKCEELMRQGVILITIDDKKSGAGWNKPDGSDNWMPNPYRTGVWFVVRDEAVSRLFPSMAEWAIKHRFMFIEHEAAEMIGLFKAEPAMKKEEKP